MNDVRNWSWTSSSAYQKDVWARSSKPRIWAFQHLWVISQHQIDSFRFRETLALDPWGHRLISSVSDSLLILRRCLQNEQLAGGELIQVKGSKLPGEGQNLFPCWCGFVNWWRPNIWPNLSMVHVSLSQCSRSCAVGAKFGGSIGFLLRLVPPSNRSGPPQCLLRGKARLGDGGNDDWGNQRRIVMLRQGWGNVRDSTPLQWFDRLWLSHYKHSPVCKANDSLWGQGLNYFLGNKAF
jgi:hypothetical protein